MKRLGGIFKRENLSRFFLIFIAVTFLATTVVVSIIGFMEATRERTDTSDQSQAEECAFDVVQDAEVLSKPEAYKPSGDVKTLGVTDLQEGTGATVRAGDCVTTKYHGTLATSGDEFDSNFDSPQAIKFVLGQGQVIPGWDQGLQGMKVGGIRRLVIPSELAYGDQAQGSIPANSDLVFVVKVLDSK